LSHSVLHMHVCWRNDWWPYANNVIIKETRALSCHWWHVSMLIRSYPTSMRQIFILSNDGVITWSFSTTATQSLPLDTALSQFQSSPNLTTCVPNLRRNVICHLHPATMHSETFIFLFAIQTRKDENIQN
jgi:hypothetical protein